jgi:hypothetical protein
MREGQTLFERIPELSRRRGQSHFSSRTQKNWDSPRQFWCLWAAIAALATAPGRAAEAPAADSSMPAMAAAGGPMSPQERLQPLAWLLGEWTGMTDNAVVLVSAHWCDGGAFIEREIVVRPTGQPEIGGTQRIGWDPIKQQIKCWTFDSQGGSGEGYWRSDGKSWIVESEEVLADGHSSSTTSIFTPQGPDRFIWEVERASVNGEGLPKQRIEFVRAKAGE